VASAQAAAEVLALGGNAVDAAVAGMLAAAMAEPVLTSLGGGGFCLVAEPGAAPQYLDFFVDTPGLGGVGDAPQVASVVIRFGTPANPQAEQVFHAGWGTVAVPGCFAGYLDAHERWGRVDRAQVVAPALRLAREGVVLDAIQQDFLRLVRDVLSVTESSARLYADAFAGRDFTNAGYGELLESIARGATMTSDAFAEPLLSHMSTHGGLVTEQDLAHYTPQVRRPLLMMREGASIWTNPPPSFGGAIVLDALGCVAPADTLDWPAIAYHLRAATERQRARDRAAHNTEVSRGTTHISVVDGDGRIAALTTSNGSASGTQVRGVQLNNMLGEEDLNPHGLHMGAPGQRMGSMMTPTLVDLDDGARVAFGSGGSERIRSAHVGVLARLIDTRASLRDAIVAPRVHPTDTGVEIEPGISPDGFAERDFATDRVRVWPNADLYFGGVHGVRLGADGSIEAVGDPRRGGAAALVRR
jgi:gamma-glutamyltranspeptidase/glutathione hydrolase